MTLSFGTWIRTQTNRRDEVGCLALQVYEDDCMPYDASYGDFIWHIKDEHQRGNISGPVLILIGAAKDAYDRFLGSVVR